MPHPPHPPQSWTKIGWRTSAPMIPSPSLSYSIQPKSLQTGSLSINLQMESSVTSPVHLIVQVLVHTTGQCFHLLTHSKPFQFSTPVLFGHQSRPLRLLDPFPVLPPWRQSHLQPLVSFNVLTCSSGVRQQFKSWHPDTCSRGSVGLVPDVLCWTDLSLPHTAAYWICDGSASCSACLWVLLWGTCLDWCWIASIELFSLWKSCVYLWAAKLLFMLGYLQLYLCKLKTIPNVIDVSSLKKNYSCYGVSSQQSSLW